MQTQEEWKQINNAACRRWRITNAEYDQQRQLAWRQANPEYQARWAAANKEKINARKRVWARQNRAKLRRKELAQKFARRRACPPWAERAPLLAFYRACPPGFHVDHVIPLRGKLVCGLHCLDNLQYLPAQINLQKANRFSPE